MIDNSGKVALIFGIRNDSSLAFNVAKKLHESGCSIAASYLPETEKSVLALLEEYVMDVSSSCNVDVRNEEEIVTFVQAAHKKYGKIDYILHSVADADESVIGLKKPGAKSSLEKYINIPFDKLVDSFNVSAYSLLRICRVAEPYLNKKASILTLTYNASQKIIPGYAGMAINKAALENIMIYLADYFGDQGIRINAISAGLVMTSSSGMITGIRKFRKVTDNTAPLGNITFDDVGNAALYYFSTLSEKVTGNIHYVDGGYNIMGVARDGS